MILQKHLRPSLRLVQQLTLHQPFNTNKTRLQVGLQKLETYQPSYVLVVATHLTISPANTWEWLP